MRRITPERQMVRGRNSLVTRHWLIIMAALALLALPASPISTGQAARLPAPFPAGQAVSNSAPPLAALPLAALPAAASPAGGPQLRVVALSIREVYLSWTADASGASSYKITRNGQALTSVDTNTLSYSDTGVQPSTTYVYQVDAVGATGPGSHQSTAVRIKTPAPPENADTMPPAEPDDLMGAASPGRVDLEWGDSSDDTDVSAYVLRRNGQVLAIVDTGTRTYADTTVQPGRQYVYTVEALDVVGHRSQPADPFTVTAVASTGSTLQTQSAAADTAGARQKTQSQPLTANTTGAAQTTQSQLLAPMAPTTAVVTTTLSPALKRYPYLTDTVNQNATVNFATDRSGTKASVKYGQVGAESCTAHTVSATKTNLTVNSVSEYQWKAQLPVAANTQYCYRVYLGSTDLLGTNGSPQFWSQLPAGSTLPFTFAVFGDWGSTNSTGANPDQANLMAQLAASVTASGTRFAVTTGDNSYPSGSQTNYGDLWQTGSNISNVFGPSFWAQVGASMPLFPTIGNHGFASSATLHPQLQNFPQDTAVTSSGGRYTVENYPSVNGSTAASYPSTWYAFDAGVARFYVLEAAWADANASPTAGTGTVYQNDHDSHWTASNAEYQWLQSDLDAHRSQPVKFAFLHYPLYSDNVNESSDASLQGANGLEGLLNTYGVTIAFEGHSHNYQRFNAPNAGSLPTLLTGGGGAQLTPMNIKQCYAFTAYAMGWSYSANNGAGGSSLCTGGTAPVLNTLPSVGQVFSYALVTVDSSAASVTVRGFNSQGTLFDQQTYAFTPPPATPTATATSTPTATATATATSTPTATATAGGPSPTPTATATATATATPPAVFSDGFESGNLTQWTSSGGLVVENSIIHGGTYAAQGSTTVGATYAKKTLPTTTSYTNGYARIYFDVISLSTSNTVNLLRLRTAADGSLAYLYVAKDGTLGMRNDVAATNTASTTVVPLSSWHALELHATINGTSSATDVWLDGVKISALSLPATNLGTTAIGKVQIGEVNGSGTWNVVFDDIVFKTQYIGP